MSSVVSLSIAEEKAQSRIWFPFHLTLAASLAVFTFFFCGHSIADPDIWWHLKNAQVLFAQHHWIYFDQYSYTVKGTPWVDSEWLSEVLFYGAWKLGGAAGIFAFYVGTVEMLMMGLLYLAYKASGSIKASALAGAVGMVLAVVNFGPRTILFGWACLLLLMFVLWKQMNTGNAPVWAIPVIFLFWINLHGSWLIGLIVLGAVVGCGFVSGTWGHVIAEKWTKEQGKRLLLACAAVLPVLFINPYGYKGVFYPFDLAYRQKLNVEHVEEWASINFHEPRGKIVYGVILCLLLLALIGRRKWKLAEVVLVAFALYTSLTYVRFLFPAAILITPILARQLDFVPPYNRKIDRSWLNLVFSLALIAVVVHRYPSPHTLNDDLDKKMPVAGIRFLQTHAAPGDRVLNHYMFGGYMIWSTPPIPTFIDSRTDIFEYKGILQDYLDVIGLKDSLKIIDRYHAKYVFFPSKDPVTYLLHQSTKWKVVYDDGVSCVFERVA
jgi:hypothetical protein